MARQTEFAWKAGIHGLAVLFISVALIVVGGRGLSGAAASEGNPSDGVQSAIGRSWPDGSGVNTTSSVAEQKPAFPLAIRPGERYLVDAAGKPFEDVAAREALFAGIRSRAGDVEIIERDCHINDPEFAELLANSLLGLLSGSGVRNPVSSKKPGF